MDTGTVRKMDDLGRIVIPAETRRRFHINSGDDLTIAVAGDQIMIQKLDATCTFCGSSGHVRRFHDKGICDTCATDAAEINQLPRHALTKPLTGSI